jgi:hypothetical protein
MVHVVRSVPDFAGKVLLGNLVIVVMLANVTTGGGHPCCGGKSVP